MNCKQTRSELLESVRRGLAIPPEHHAHVKACTDCAQFYNGQLALTSALNALPPMEETAPAQLEGFLLAEFDAAVAKRFRFPWRIALAAVAVCLVAALAVFRQPVRRPTPTEVFLEIPYTTPPAPYEITHVKRMDIPLAALVAVGFTVRAVDFGATVRADVLLGQDGRAHAIRVVSPIERRIIQ